MQYRTADVLDIETRPGRCHWSQRGAALVGWLDVAVVVGGGLHFASASLSLIYHGFSHLARAGEGRVEVQVRQELVIVDWRRVLVVVISG